MPGPAGRPRPAPARASAVSAGRSAAPGRGPAGAAGRRPLAGNLARAAELTSVPAESILEIYTALRPHRSSAEELEGWARRLESEWEAPLTAAFVREASDVYAKRGLLAAERAPV